MTFPEGGHPGGPVDGPRGGNRIPAVVDRARRARRVIATPFTVPVEHGQMERFRAFTPGLNTGSRDPLNAPARSRVAALALDAAIFSALYLVLVAATAIATGNALWYLVLPAGPLPFWLWKVVGDANGGGPGKRLLGLRVTGPADCPVGVGQAARRNLWLLLPAVPVVGPVAALAVGMWLAGSAKLDAYGMGSHDRFARTRVIVRG
ncbi:RDD family protein [Corynebacterium pygosceleis]|uniref:RDD family protein n=1 Tax=Corynebacterium pygosceleis TaxID=2800406 RepID=A0A9Q4GLB6_9CORY|nr:RDD family protein [Corynebacterium pygosceleis]MCK7638379.1 RDD family protein [Corynebacterium pygosceleis]MCK7675359.1 RDD family protein [Corynebacterium pygosceleis]MCL0121247.1 RDD family protein [Corynebacterium pygosceleis]MCX7445462.1 RDD family protein [Corynebacterium pygosceleis]MCX7469042.1 RDD family protein [Corynebacterium pygosceleis]